jgi:hypothetical protein
VDALTSLQSARQKYLDGYRRVIREQKDEHPGGVTPEIWIRSNPGPGDDRIVQLCVDILVGGEENPQMISVSNTETPEGALVGALRVGKVDAKVFPIVWEMCVVWFRHPHRPDSAIDIQAILQPWRSRWIDPERGADPADEDGLSGSAHYLSEPIAEGGGHLLEVDFGSAPIEALTDLLTALGESGATEIEVGRSDGSDLDPAIAAELERTPQVAQQRVTEIIVSLLERLEEVQSVRTAAPDQITVRVRGEGEDLEIYTGNIYRRLLRVGGEARAKEMSRCLRSQRDVMRPDRNSNVPELSQLRPVVKDDQFIGHVQRQTQGKFSLLARKLVADLWICYVWDQPNGMRFVVTDEPGKYGLSDQELHDRAVKNFLEARPPVDLSDDGPIRIARTHDSYDATLLLDDGFWDEQVESANVVGDLLACVPSRDMVLFTDSTKLGAT